MGKWKKFFFWQAVSCFCIAIVVHLMTYIFPGWIGKIPGLFALHILLFPPFGFGIATLKKEGKAKLLSEKPKNAFDSMKKIMPFASNWLQMTAVFFFLYAVVNFYLFIHQKEGSPAFKEGAYYLHNHGTKIRDITREEFYYFMGLEIRGFSGHWMIFYLLPIGMLFPKRRTGASL